MDDMLGMTYKNWKERSVNPNEVLLDVQNPRIPPREEEFSQKELLIELVRHDKVLNLARAISNNGFFPGELPILVEEKGKLIVIEGNRRIAACKLLLNPTVAPNGYISKFQSLSRSADLRALQKITVLVAGSREEVNHVLIARHTTRTVEPWGTLMQAKFYYGLIKNSGLPPDEIAIMYSVTTGELIEHSALHQLYAYACLLKLPEDVAEKVHNQRDFPATTLNRFLAIDESRELLGITINNRGMVSFKRPKNDFNKILAHICSDIVTKEKEVNSRTLNSSADITGYLSKVINSIHPKKKVGRPQSLEKIIAESTRKKKKDKPSRGKPQSKRYLVPENWNARVDNSRVKKILEELKTLPVNSYQNSAAFLLRGLIEMSASHYIYSNNLIGALKDELRRTKFKNNNFPKHWTPSLEEMLEFLGDGGAINNGKITKALKKIKSEHLFTMNLFAHNESYHPNYQKLVDIFSDSEEFLKFILKIK